MKKIYLFCIENFSCKRFYYSFYFICIILSRNGPRKEYFTNFHLAKFFADHLSLTVCNHSHYFQFETPKFYCMAKRIITFNFEASTCSLRTMRPLNIPMIFLVTKNIWFLGRWVCRSISRTKKYYY